MSSLLKRTILALTIVMTGGAAMAQIADKLYGTVRGWEVRAAGENGVFLGCGTTRPGNNFDMLLLLSRDNIWELGFPTYYAAQGAQVVMDMDLDRYSDQITGVSDGTYARSSIDPVWVDSLAKGNTLWVRMEGAQYQLSLRGSAAAILKVQECVNRYNAASSFNSNITANNQGNAPAPVPHAAVVPPVESDTARMAVGCPAYGAYRSANSGQAADVQFVNFTSRALTVYWIDSSGRNVEMGGVLPDQAIGFNTFVGDVWIAKDFDATCYGGVWTVSRGQNRFELQ
jgi:VHL beta domain